MIDTERQFGKTSRIILQNGQYLSEKSAGKDMTELAMQMLNGQVQTQLQQLLRDASVGPTTAQTQQSSSLPEVLPAAASRIAKEEQADLVLGYVVNQEVRALEAELAAAEALKQAEDEARRKANTEPVETSPGALPPSARME